MKTTKGLSVLFIFLTMAFSTQAKAIVHSPFYTISATTGDNDSVLLVQIEKRVNEIENMDIKNMSASQKHSLRIEVKQMMKQESTCEHPYLACDIASGVVLIIILFAVYVMLK